MDAKKQEFIQLLKQTGWSQAEAARRLEMTRAGVNGIVTGNSVPSLATLKLFHLLVSSDGEMHRAGWETEIIHDLRLLNEDDLQRVMKVLRTMIADLPKRELPRRELIGHGREHKINSGGAGSGRTAPANVPIDPSYLHRPKDEKPGRHGPGEKGQ